MPLDGTALSESGSRPRTARRRSGVSLFLGRDSSPERLAAVREVWAGALCSQVDAELFFPEKGEPTRDAKSVCAACPVRAACLTAFGDLSHGVVAGLSVAERRARRDQGAAA